MTTHTSNHTRALPKAHHIHRVIAATTQAEHHAFMLSEHPMVLHAVVSLRQARKVLCGEAAWDLIVKRKLSVKETAAVLQISQSTVRRWLDTALKYHTAFDTVHPAQTATKEKGHLSLVVNNTGAGVHV